MPTEFFKYAERTAGSQINWADIGANVTQMLQDEVDFREKKKAEIDEATNKTLETLINKPIGEGPDGNKFITDYSHDATSALLMQNKLLKSGKLKPKDYVLFKSNIDMGTKSLFNLQKEYQKQYARKMERMKSNDPATRSQALEVDLAGYLEGFGDLSRSKALINPTTGNVNVGIMETGKDGVDVLSDKVMNVGDVYKALAQDFNYFDSLGTSKGIADKLAPVVIETIKSEGTVGTKGKLETIDYALQKKETQEAFDKMIDSFLTNQYNISSILTDDIGTYNNVFSEEERAKDPKNSILWKMSKSGAWTAELTDEQKRVAKDYLTEITKAQVGEKITTEVFESAAMGAAELKIRQQKLALDKAEHQLKRKIAEKTNEDIYTPFAEYLDNQWSAHVTRKENEKEDPDRAVNGLNAAYGGLGYRFVRDGNRLFMTKPTNKDSDKDGVSDMETVSIIPFKEGIRNSVKSAIIEDLAGSPNGVKKIIALKKGVVDAQPTNDNDPLGIR